MDLKLDISVRIFCQRRGETRRDETYVESEWLRTGSESERGVRVVVVVVVEALFLRLVSGSGPGSAERHLQ